MIKARKKRRRSTKQNQVAEPKVKPGGAEDHDVGTNGEGQSYAVFFAGLEKFAIDLDSIIEILHTFDLVSVPHLPETFSGVVDLRGESIPVVDLQRLLNEKRADTETRTCLITSVGSAMVGLLVDSDVEIVPSDEGEIRPLPDCYTKEETEFLNGIFWVKDEFIGILKPKRMMEVLAAWKENNEKA